jgi:hypothetical protein
MKGITMTFKTAAKSFGNGLLTTATVLHNSGLSTRISEIDQEIEPLQRRIDELNQERQNLIDSRI